MSAAVGSGWALRPWPGACSRRRRAQAGPQPSARVCRTRRANRAHRVADGAAALVNYEYEHPARPTPGLSNDRTNVSRRSVASIRSSTSTCAAPAVDGPARTRDERANDTTHTGTAEDRRTAPG